MDDRERHSAGMKVRREVLGAAHVDRAESTKTSFTEPFQDLITRYAWGEIWSRPGLPRQTRSLISAKKYRKSCCSRLFIAVCRRPIRRFTWPRKFSRRLTLHRDYVSALRW
jgi:hypothetical protein